MKLASLGALVALFALVALQGAASAPDDMATIIEISTARLHAMSAGDQPTLTRYTSRTGQFIDPDGGMSNKVFQAITKYPDTVVWSSKPQVRFIGGAALLTGKLHEVEVFPGGSVVHDFVKTELYAKEDGHWLVQATQATMVPHNYATPMPNPPTNLRAFVGRYRWFAGRVDTIALHGNTLTSAFVGESPDPTFFIGRDSVTYPNDLSVTTFYYNRDHKVAGYVYRRCDGQTVRASKLP